MSLSDYTFEKTIGKGSYGKVYKVVNTKNSKVYALKKIKVHPVQQVEKFLIMNELRVLATHQSNYLIRFKTAFLNNEYLCMVMEFAEKGDLSGLIKTKSRQHTFFTENEVWHYFLQISAGLSYLHNLNIIHRDIKPANIFIDKYNNVKIGDLGIIKIMKNYMMYGQTQIGTPLYMSPEIYKRERYDIKVDIWALGCILYELMTLKPAFFADNISDLKCKIYAGRFNFVYYTSYRQELKDLLKRLINIQPRLRPTISGLLNTPYVKKQLTLRCLNLENIKIKAPFYENCIVPRKLEDWNHVIHHYANDMSITIFNEHDRERIRVIQEANLEAQKLMEKTKMEKEELNIKIKKAQEVVNAAETDLKQKKDILYKLIQQLNRLQNVLPQRSPISKFVPNSVAQPRINIQPLTPKPPPKPPVNPRPNSRLFRNIQRDIQPTPKRSDRLR